MRNDEREGIFSDPLLWVLPGGLLALLLAIPLLTYGTLRPCQMLGMDVRVGLMDAIAREAAQPARNQFEHASKGLAAGLAAALVGPVVENYLASMGPLQCVRDLVRLKSSPQAVLAEVQTRGLGIPPLAPKPRLEWQTELSVRSSRYSKEFGVATFTGEVENIGTHTLTALTVHVAVLDESGKEIAEHAQPLLSPIEAPMTPGHVKPFTVLLGAVSGLGREVRYRFDIDDYN